MSEGIKEILKIKKRAYKFELRRKFFNKKGFKVIKKTPFEIIKKEIQTKLFQKRQPGDGAPKKNWFVIAAFLMMVLAFIIAIMQPYQQETPKQTSDSLYLLPTFNLEFSESGIANIGSKDQRLRTAYYKLNYSVDNANKVSVKTVIYDDFMPNQVFVLRSKNEQATNYVQFQHALKELLAEKGLPVNEISLEQIETLPSGAILVVPTGLIPEKMIKPGNAHLMNLLNRGIVVIYIGQQFEQTITETKSNRRITKEELEKLPFYFESANLNSDGALYLASTLYKVKGSEGSAWYLLYGMISAGNVKKGKMIFVPQTLDGGWGRAYQNAASDISKIIAEMQWASPKGESEFNLNIKKNASDYSFFYSPSFSERKKSVIVRVVASNPSHSIERIKIFYPRADTNGDLYFIALSGEENSTILVSGKITETNTQFITHLRENTSDKRKLFMSIKNVFGAEVERNPVSLSLENEGRIGLSETMQQFPNQLRLEKGIYLASIVDNTSNAYARAIIHIDDVNFEPILVNFQQKTFNFTVKSTSTGKPVRVPTVRVSVDEKYNYTFADTFQIGLNLEPKLSGKSLEAGNHTFDFEIGQFRKRATFNYTITKQFYDNPIIWVLSILSIFIILGAPLLASLLKKKECALDIPDFPPLSSIKIPMTKETVLGIIERINTDYKWKFTPLRLEEIKKGFKKIIYQNKPIFISDYNLEYLLERIKGKGDIKEALDYYGIVKWEQDSGRSMIYLAIQRKMRDVCINNAIPFSKFGESSEYDIKLQVLGQDIFVFIFDLPQVREKKLSQALKLIHSGLVVLLFENAEAKRDFEDTISSSSESSGIIKMEIMAGSIVPFAINEFEKMLKEMKQT